jgi:hypothetical protein
MIFRYYGLEVSQETIINTMNQSSEAHLEDAGMFEVWLAMNPDLAQEMERRKAAWDKTGTKEIVVGLNASDLGNVIRSMTNPSSDGIVQEISSGNPVVIGLHGGQWGNGHIVLAYEVDYSRLNPKGEIDYQDLSMIYYRFRHRFKVNKVKVIDPSPLIGQSQYIEIGAGELGTCQDFSVGKTDARKQLEAYMKAYLPTPDEMSSGRPIKK